jgi:hypothetical protein
MSTEVVKQLSLEERVTKRLHETIGDLITDADLKGLVEQGIERNTEIVDDSDHLFAAPKEQFEQLRSGTWATVRRARKKGIPYEILLP